MDSKSKWQDYWKRNQRIIIIFLAIWFLISYFPALLMGIVGEGVLNSIVIAGFPLGYYLGAQGSLIGFVLLIFFYARYMNRMDDEYHVQDTTKRLTQAEQKAKIREN